MISIVVVDDHPEVRAALLEALSELGDLEVVDSCADGETAVGAVLRQRPAVVVMDMRLHGIDGLEATRRIIAAWPQARILIHTGEPSTDLSEAALNVGAVNVIAKSTRTEHLVSAIRNAVRQL